MSYTDAAVAGIYQTQQGDLSGRTQPEVWWECVTGACADAGIEVGHIDGMIGPRPKGVGIRTALPTSPMADALGHPTRFHAAMAKLSGQYEYPYGGTRVLDYATLTRRHMHQCGTLLRFQPR